MVMGGACFLPPLVICVKEAIGNIFQHLPYNVERNGQREAEEKNREPAQISRPVRQRNSRADKQATGQKMQNVIPPGKPIVKFQ